MDSSRGVDASSPALVLSAVEAADVARAVAEVAVAVAAPAAAPAAAEAPASDSTASEVAADVSDRPSASTLSPGGWQRLGDAPPLSEMAGRVAVHQPGTAGCGRTFSRFVGPAVLIAVGYMEPGNWATGIAAGAAYGYTHLFVVGLASVIAMFLQCQAVRLGIGTGRDLAQSCRDSYSRPVVLMLWFTAEVAIMATDVAEVIGTAIALKLLFRIPLAGGVVLTVCDTLLVSLLHSRVRLVECIVAVLVALITGCFAAQLAMARPPAAEVLRGFLPNSVLVRDAEALYLAVGILGATVMPHNLYLHSALVHTRAIDQGAPAARAQAVRFLSLDSILALSVALVVNALILIVAGAAFHGSGNSDVGSLEHAYELLAPLLGSAAAPILFAIALLAAGQNSTLTGVMAGQVVMEGFLRWRIGPVARRLITRVVAVIPVVIVAVVAGDAGVQTALVLSQVILSFQVRARDRAGCELQGLRYGGLHSAPMAPYSHPPPPLPAAAFCAGAFDAHHQPRRKDEGARERLAGAHHWLVSRRLHPAP